MKILLRMIPPPKEACAGRLMTHFPECDRAIYVEAVKRSGDTHLFVSEKRGDGRPGGGLYTDGFTLSHAAFWQIFYQLRANK